MKNNNIQPGEAMQEAHFVTWDETASRRTIQRVGYRRNVPACDDTGNAIYLENGDRATRTEYFFLLERKWK